MRRGDWADGAIGRQRARRTIVSASAADCGIPAVIDDGWKIATPASVRLDTHLLCQWVDRYLADPKENVHSVIVVRRGALVLNVIFLAMINYGAWASAMSLMGQAKFTTCAELRQA